MNHDLIETATQPENPTENQLVAPRVADTARDAFLAALFPGLVMFGELTIYAKPVRISAKEQRGYRDISTPMNSDRYPTSVADSTFEPARPGHGLDSRVEADATGVVATRYAWSEECINCTGHTLADRLAQLRVFVALNPGGSSVLGVIN